MIVNIDIQSAIAQRAGVGRYTKHLVEQLAQQNAGDELRLAYFDFKRQGTPFQVRGATQCAVRWIPGSIAQKAWKTIHWPPYDAFFGKADVYHFPNFVRPPLSTGKSVVTVHDVSFLRLPETTEAKNLRYLTSEIENTVKTADAIVADSAFTAREIAALLPVDESKIHAIHLGLSEHVALNDDGKPEEVLSRLGIKRPYLLHVGTVEPRKNIPFLIDVFEQMKDFDGSLVLAGMKGWKYDPIIMRMKTSSRSENINYLDYVAESDLAALYAGASAFVFPSLYEGFGFPPLEAMAHGVPVVSSSAGSLPEVLGDAAVLLDAFEAKPWADVMMKLLDDEPRRGQMRDAGRQQAAKFTWDETARKTWNLYREVAS